MLASLRDSIDRMKQLVEDKQIKADASYLGGVLIKSLGDAAKEFRQRGEIELSNECGLLRIKCSEIFTISKGEDDSDNFTNFYDMANSLNAAKEQNLHLRDDAKKYYENYAIYIEKAILLGEEAIKNTKPQDSNGPKFYSSLADAYRLRGNLKREKKQPSSEDYQRGIELFKALGDIIYTNKVYLDWDVERLAECYFFRSDYKSAIKEYEILFEKSDTKKYQAALGLGNVHDAMGEFLSAKVWYLECLKISQDPPAYDKLIHLHRKHGYYEDTIEWQKKMIGTARLSKEDLDCQYFRLGILYEEKGNVEEAIKTFRYIVTERQPDSLRSLDHLISLLMLKEESEDYQEAIKWLGKKIELSTKLVWDYCRLGDCYLSLNNDSTAFEYYEKALAIDPTALSSLQRIAKWHELKEQYSKSVELVKKMIETVGDEKSDGHYKWLGDLYWKLKDKDPAIDAYYNSLRIKRGQTEIYDRIEKITGRVSTQFLIERVSELERQYKDSPSPELATEIVTRCIGIQDKQHANKAFEFLPKSVYKPESYDYYEKLARIYENLGQYDSAIKTQQKINALDSLEPYLILRNLRAIAELISEKRLSHHYRIKSNCIKEMEDFMEKVIPDECLTEEIDIVKEDELQETIYTFQYELHYLADHYSVNGYYSKAHEYIRKLLRCNKYNLQNDRVYLQTEADVLSKMERFEEAEKSLYKILAKEGDDPIALFTLGKIYRRKKDFREAIRYFRKCYEVSDFRNRVKAADQIGGTLRDWINVPHYPTKRKKK
ncbi:MAG: Lipopolysaccharide assembly protein B [Actinobacteria bacterium]|nr:Lipopolysaccharide assembly protein B [Actinomycetota bacterium]